MPMRTIAGGMLRSGTPVEDHTKEYGLWVKREDLSCPLPGPPFSKARGVYARVLSREEEVIGVLDTRHSQAGHAVARACQVLGKKCINFYPEFKHDKGLREPQIRAAALGAELVPLPAGRSAILYHTARKETNRRGGYLMPNALKLEESVSETARETLSLGRQFGVVVIPTSSGTIAAGTMRGMGRKPLYVVHLGYSRSHAEVRRYLRDMSCVEPETEPTIVDEGYAYADAARPGPTPPWPCNEWYDLKAFRWWMREGREQCEGLGDVLFWNIG